MEIVKRASKRWNSRLLKFHNALQLKSPNIYTKAHELFKSVAPKKLVFDYWFEALESHFFQYVSQVALKQGCNKIFTFTFIVYKVCAKDFIGSIDL